MRTALVLSAACLASSVVGQAKTSTTESMTSPAKNLNPQQMLLSEAPRLLTTNYATEVKGWVKNTDGMYHVAANTWFPNATGAMIDWWFGYVTTTEQYKMWHPFDHIYSEWSGPHGNSTYIGGNHLVFERIGGEEQHLRIQFRSPQEYFGDDWRAKFKAANVSTAACGRVGFWAGKGMGPVAVDVGHLIHLVQDEPGGVRMRSRFWLGDVGVPVPAAIRAAAVPMRLVTGLVKHASEEMHYLQGFLPDLYRRETAASRVKRRWEREVIPFNNE